MPSSSFAPMRFAASSNVDGLAGIELRYDGGPWQVARPQQHPQYPDGLGAR